MVATEQEFSHSPEFESRLLEIRQKYRISPDAIDKFCTNSSFIDLNHPFEEDYKSSQTYEKKFVIAEALIKDGRYVKSHKDPRYLVRDFVPRGREVTPDLRTLRDILHMELIEQGITPQAKSEDEKEAQDAFLRAIQQDRDLVSIGGVLPIPVFEAATRVKFWGKINDEEKLRKIRSFAMGAMLRDELGNILIYVPRGDIDLRNLILQFPESVFSNIDYVTSNIVRHFFTKQALQLYTDGEEEGFRRLNDLSGTESSEIKREFFGQIEKEFRQHRAVPIPPVFVDSVEGWYTDRSPMPLFMHKFLIDRFLGPRRKIWNGGTGATKTAAFYQAMETVGAEHTIVFGPAKARNTWPEQANEIYLEGHKPDVFTIKNYQDLDNPRMNTAKVVFIGAEFLGRAWGNNELHQKIKTAVARRKVDMVGIDESHEFRNQKAGSSLMLMELMEDIRTDYQEKNLLELPAIALTATPISTGLDNMDITMALLYPEKFALPDRYERGKTTFSIQALRDPMIAFSLLYGEQLMEQWDISDLFGEKVPKPEYERVLLPMSPYQRVIYEWVRGVPINPLSKIRYLRSVLLNPELIKDYFEKKGLTPAAISREDLNEQIRALHLQWSDWSRTRDERIPNEPFSADWIAKFGGGDFLLQCFFSPILASGVDTLAETIPDVRLDWKRPRAVTPKYEFLMDFLQTRVPIDHNGEVVKDFIPTERVFITVPYHRRGITRWMEDPNSGSLDDNALSLYEYMLTEWLPGLPANMAITIDASRSFAARARIAKAWRESGMEYPFIVATMDTMNESMNWATHDSSDNQNISVINAISMGLPWTAEERDQWGGRFIRPMLGKTVRHLITETEESIDTNGYDLVKLRSLIMQMTLAAVPPREQDREFYKSSTTARRIIISEPNVGQSFLLGVLSRLKGSGEQEVQEELSKTKNGRSFFDLFAEFYFDNGRDEFRIPGSNNEMEKNIALPYRPRRVLSIGAGSCLFARKLRQAGYKGLIDNVDMNPVILRTAKERFPEIGNIRVEVASTLSTPSEYYDLVEDGFIGPWTKQISPDEKLPLNEIERVRFHSERNRVLKFGGISIETFPESAFDEETFTNYTQALAKHFGFKIIEPSGISYTTDLKPSRRIGWVITTQKVGEPNLSGLDPMSLSYLSDDRTRISKPKRRKDSEPKIIKIEYPIFSSKRFEVRNPLTNEISPVDPTTIEEGSIDSPRNLADRVKDGLTETQYRVWNTFRRDLQKGTGREYTDAEEILAGIVTRRGVDRLQDWDSDIIRRITVDVNRFIKRN